MIIKTRRNLPAASWLQTRSKFCLTIDKHPLKTGLQTLAWLEPYSLNKLNSFGQKNRFLILLMIFLCTMGAIIYPIQMKPLIQHHSPKTTLSLNQKSSILSPAFLIRPENLMQSWDNGWTMWMEVQKQWKNKLAQIQSQQLKQNQDEIALAQHISVEYKIAPKAAKRVVHQAYKAANNQGIDPVLLLSVVGVESRFNPLAGSNAGAVGLVQAMAKAHPEKVSNILEQGGSLTDIDANLNLGAQILKEYLIRQKGNIPRALEEYHGSLYDQRQAYAHKVFAVKSKFDKVLNSRNV